MATKTIATILNLKDNFSETIKKTTANTNAFTKEISSSKSVISSFKSNVAESFKGITGSILGIAGTYVGVKSVFDYVKGGMEMAKSSEAGVAQLGAVLTSTNNAVGMSKDSLLDLAGSYGAYTTYTKGAVLSGENLLLTFTNLGKDIFPDVTTTMLDMSTALKQDVTTSALQLGKSLNDPTQGLTALKRVGVSFTESQQEQIKTLQSSGDVMGAQKLILQELQKEFGGSAKAIGETLPGKITIMQNAFKGIQKSIGEKFIPVLYSFYSFGVEKMPTIKSFFTSAFNVIGDGVNAVVSFLKNDLIPTFEELWTDAQPTLLKIKDGVANAFSNILPIASQVFDFIKTTVLDNKQTFEDFIGSVFNLATTIYNNVEPAIQDLANAVLPALQGSLDSNKGIINDILTGATDTFNFINDNWSTIAPIVGGIVLAIGEWKLAMIACEIYAGILTIATGAWSTIELIVWGIVNATSAWEAVQWLLNVAMDANPVGAVIIVITALGVAIYEVVTHFKEICEWVEKAWDWLTKWNGTDAEDKTVTVNENTQSAMTTDPLDGQTTSFGMGYNATGTQYWKGGQTVVGEHGKEVVTLPTGSKVSTASETQKMLSPNGGVNVYVTVQGNVIGNEEYADSIGQHIWNKISSNLINT